MISLNKENPYISDFTKEVEKYLIKKLDSLINNNCILGRKYKVEDENENDPKYKYFIDCNTQIRYRKLIKCEVKNRREEKKLLRYIRKNLTEVLSSNIEELYKFIETIEEKYSEIKEQDTNIYKLINHVFVINGYESKITKGDKKSIAYEIVKSIGVKTCPYCNRNYISLIEKTKDSKRTRPQLDHFLPKSKYPYLACSFFNLIPSCSTCNLMKSDDDFKDKDFCSPYNIEEYDVSFSYKLKDLNFLNTIDINNINLNDEESVEIIVESKYLQNDKCFELSKLYQNHKDTVLELILKKIHYPSSYINELINSNFATEEEIYRFLFSNYLNSKDMHKRPLSKLTRDIVEELGILYKIETLIKERNS